jgi:glutathione S-transferase
MLKVYGIKGSRAIRTLWLCRELGLEHENVKVSYLDAATKTPEFLAINPSGKIPTIDDDGFGLWESMAISVYLAKKNNSPLMPKDLKGEALVLQWSFWVMSEVEKPLLTTMLQRAQFADPTQEKYFRERNPKNPETERLAVEALQKPLATLETYLNKSAFLLGGQFTLADLNVASVMLWVPRANLDLSAFPKTRQWLDTCLARPAAKS